MELSIRRRKSPLSPEPLAALTGATGFLGAHLAASLAARGFRLRILTRRDCATRAAWRPGTEVIRGDLGDVPALARLVRDADVVIHAAGLIKAVSRAEFLAVNRDGAARLAAAMRSSAPGAHLIAISSLAARAPFLSPYAHSKQAGERALREGFPGRLTVIRPPVIYGPGDRETLGIFRAAARRLVPVPAPADIRIAMVHVSDAACAIAALAGWSDAPGGGIHALADPNPAGYAPREILLAAAMAVGGHPRLVPLPGSVVRLAGLLAGLHGRVRGRAAMFSAGKAGELLYPDWGIRPHELLPAPLRPGGIDLHHGFASTVAWYREAGWLA